MLLHLLRPKVSYTTMKPDLRIKFHPIPGNVSRSSFRYPCTEEEYHLLAALIHAEARGEGFIGKVAVGSVVINRMKNTSFPKTIKDVILQPKQFTAISDGQIHLNPEKESYLAAELALKGHDPTEGCLYYYNPTISTSKWIFTRKTLKVIDNHRFAI